MLGISVQGWALNSCRSQQFPGEHKPVLLYTQVVCLNPVFISYNEGSQDGRWGPGSHCPNPNPQGPQT